MFKRFFEMIMVAALGTILAGTVLFIFIFNIICFIGGY